MLTGDLAAPCYLQPAIAGANSLIEVHKCVAALSQEAVTNGSCAIEGCESCQVGNQAALNSLFNVP